MYFKVYRDVDSKRLRKVTVALYNAAGELQDETYMFYYLAVLGFRMRVRARQMAMLRLHRQMTALSGPIS